MEPGEGFGDVGGDGLAVAELGREDDAEGGQEEDGAEGVFVAGALDDTAVALVEVEQFVVLFLLGQLMHERV